MYRWSTKRTVKQLERIIMSLGYDRFDDIDIHGYTIRGASSYIHVKPLELTIRVSDHSQPFHGNWGGYDLTRGERHTAADFSISPTEKTVAEFKTWLLEQISEAAKSDTIPPQANDEGALDLEREQQNATRM